MGRTKKPCPGCGEVDEYRPATEVCGCCKSLMKDGRKFRRQCHQRIGGWVQMPAFWHSLPYIHYARKPGEEFQKAFFDLVVALAAEIPSNEWAATELLPGGHHYSNGEGVYLLPADLDRLRDLYQAVIDIAESAYQEGVEKGQRFIEGLISGKTTIEKFNNATLGGEDE